MIATLEPSTAPAEAAPTGDRERYLRHAETLGLPGGVVPVLPDEEAAAVAERATRWDLAPGNPGGFAAWLAEQAAAETLRIERCRRQERAARALHARRAVLGWDEDRRAASARLAATLPMRPESVAHQLGRTRHGCLLLIERWEALAALLETRGIWSGPVRSLALDLLGVPRALRDGATPLDPPPGVDPAGHLRAVASAEVRRLKEWLADGLDDLDELERTAAALDLDPALDRALAPLRREEAAAARRLAWCLARLAESCAPSSPSAQEVSIPPRPTAEAREFAPSWFPADDSGPPPVPSGLDPALSAALPDFAAELDAAWARVRALPDPPASRDAALTPLAGRVLDAPPDPPGNRQARRAAAARARRRG